LRARQDCAADLAHFTGGLGAEVVFAIEAFGTRDAMVRLALDSPVLLLAATARTTNPILIYFHARRFGQRRDRRRVRVAGASLAGWGSTRTTRIVVKIASSVISSALAKHHWQMALIVKISR